MSNTDLAAWIGKIDQLVDDVVTPTPYSALCATLDRATIPPAPGTPLPPLWHWLYFLPLRRRSDIGPDGHPRRGDFLPPVTLPRRMWAGRQFEFNKPLRIGDCITRTSKIVDITQKSGRTGPLVFVKVRHDIHANDDASPAITELHDIVYRDSPKATDTAPPPRTPPSDALWRRRWVPSEVALFRYSALTFNAHRIHYDRRYATEVEGYPGLVVQGPLVATLLFDLLRAKLPEAVVRTCAFRAIRPLYDTHPFDLCGALSQDCKAARLWAIDHEGWLTMEAIAELA